MISSALAVGLYISSATQSSHDIFEQSTLPFGSRCDRGHDTGRLGGAGAEQALGEGIGRGGRRDDLNLGFAIKMQDVLQFPPAWSAHYRATSGQAGSLALLRHVWPLEHRHGLLVSSLHLFCHEKERAHKPDIAFRQIQQVIMPHSPLYPLRCLDAQPLQTITKSQAEMVPRMLVRARASSVNLKNIDSVWVRIDQTI